MKRLKFNRWLISLVAIIMLALVFQSDSIQDRELLPSTIPDSDYYMQNVTVYQFDINGSITNTLQAEKMQHYINDNLSVLTMPVITYSKSDRGDWKLRSPQGQLVNDSILLLEDQVTIEEFSSDRNSQSKISTQDLTIDLLKNVASTDQDVLIVSPYFRTESKGFDFDLSNEVISLNADVRTEIYQQ